MELKWTSKALSDGVGLKECVAPTTRPGISWEEQTRTQPSTILLINPRTGEQVVQVESREVRRILAGAYEVLYAIIDSTIYVLRLWHTRENR